MLNVGCGWILLSLCVRSIHISVIQFPESLQMQTNGALVCIWMVAKQRPRSVRDRFDPNVLRWRYSFFYMNGA